MLAMRAAAKVYTLVPTFARRAIMTKTAKVFTTGGSQAVRLPAEFRFEGDVVYVRRDSRTGDVVLSARPRTSWQEFMALREQLGPLPDDFLADRRQSTQTRDPLEGWRE
jgi:antitoxin VapB